MDPEEKEIDGGLKERFNSLPAVIRNAITSADVEKHLRELANTHKLHLDQWESLENEVMLTLLGFQTPEKLEDNIQAEVGVSQQTAADLAADISKAVFEPVRQELERSLDNPDAKVAQVSAVEAAGKAAMVEERVPVAPATPPPPPPEGKAVRAPVSESYKAGEASTARKSIHDDPYREPPA